MSDAKFAKHEELAVGKFTKDGHTMFSQDIIYDLNRKSHLEQVTLEQQTEINELNNHRVGQNSCIKQQREEINELKAMVDSLNNGLHLMMRRPHDEADYVGMVDRCNDIIDKTPAQCLASVKADAVEEFASVLCSPKCGFEYRLSDAAKVYADKLRKTMITTSSESSLSEVVNKINEEL